MSEFIFGYKSPTHEIKVQIPVCLLGKPDPDMIPNLKNIVGQNKGIEQDPVQENTSVVEESDAKKKKDGEELTIATGILLLSSMILAALKD